MRNHSVRPVFTFYRQARIPCYRIAPNTVKPIPKSFCFVFKSEFDKKAQVQIQSALAQLPGIDEVDIFGPTITVCYDLRYVTLVQIEQALTEGGIALPRGWLARAARALCRYLEKCDLDDMRAERKSGGRCNRPPPGV